jgi:hypothetical protein
MKRVHVLVVAVSVAIAVPSASFARAIQSSLPWGASAQPSTNLTRGPRQHVGFVIGHRTANYLNHIACRELSSRGFLALCFNTRFQNNETQVHWEETPLDVKAAVEFVRHQPGMTKVILFGHSGGGPLMSFYQAVAGKRSGLLQKPERLVKCGDDVRGLPAADAIVFADAHAGNPVQDVTQLEPVCDNRRRQAQPSTLCSIVRREERIQSEGSFTLTQKRFRDRYFAAQAKRMNELIDRALAIQERIRKGD